MWDFVKQYGPAFLVLIISFYRDQKNAAKHELKVAELEKKYLENKMAVEKELKDLNSDLIIDKYTGPGST